MKWTKIPAGELNAAEQRLRVALGDEASNVVRRFNTDPAFVELAASKIVAMNQKIADADKKFTSINSQWLHSREIMGQNFFGVEEAIQHFGVNPTRQQILALSEVPFSEEVLQKAKDTHVLMAVFPLSIVEEYGEVSWQLVRKAPVDNSTWKNWQEQQALLGKDEEVPNAYVMIYTIIGHYLVTGERLCEHICVRSSSQGLNGYHILIGPFTSEGLDVFYYWDGERDDLSGVSSAWKVLRICSF